MAANKTQPTDASAEDFVASIRDPIRRRDCAELLQLFEALSGEAPRMWGDSIVGFGAYRYRYASGRSGEWFRAGFSPRKQALTLYLMLDLEAQRERLERLGRHKRGKSCLYVRGLADIDRNALRELVLEAIRPGADSGCGGAHAAQ